MCKTGPEAILELEHMGLPFSSVLMMVWSSGRLLGGTVEKLL